jgi:RND family efflux transporter MFP subunit
MLKTTLKTLLPFALVFTAVAAAVAVVDFAPEDEPRPKETFLPVIHVMQAEPCDRQLDVEVHGTVRPRTEVSLVPRVTGRVEYVSPSLRVGGFFEKDDVLVRIERCDYELARAQAEAAVAGARARLERVEAEAELACREWETYGKGKPNALVMHKPQLAEARAAVASAVSKLAATDLSLVRTEISAPFAGRVQAENIDVGQFLTAGAPIATVFAIDHAEVRIAVPDEQIAFLDLPLVSQAKAAAMADLPEVVLACTFAGEDCEWRGKIVRTEAEIDPLSRVVYARVRVEDPYALETPGRAPLLVGMYVRATLPGKTVKNVFVLPVTALLDGNRIAVLDEEDRLRFRTVRVLRRTGDEVIVDGAIATGDRIGLTRLETAIEGMRVRVAEEDDR